MNKEITFREKYLVMSSDVDTFQELTLSGLLTIFQTLAVKGAEYVGAGKEKTLDRGYFWVLSKVEIDIKRMPKYLEEINLITFPNQMMHFIYPRSFFIKDLDGNSLIEATSYWCLLDSATRNIVTKDSANVDVPSPFKANRINKINPKEVTLKEERKVRYTDIDLNKHLNNVKYFDYISDLNDSSFHLNHKIKRVNIIFHQEVKENDIISIYASSDYTYFEFRLDDKKIWECEIEYF